MIAQLHLGKVIGKMPPGSSITIAPSKRYPWYGSWDDGDRFTRQQMRALQRRDLNPDTVETIAVRREATHRDLYIPLNTWPPIYQFDCPIIGRSGNRVRILAPDGEPSLIRSDGWATKPSTRPFTGSIF